MPRACRQAVGTTASTTNRRRECGLWVFNLRPSLDLWIARKNLFWLRLRHTVFSAVFPDLSNRNNNILHLAMKLTSILILLTLPLTQAGETIRVGIGTQDTTINCAAGGPVVRELKLLEKYLPHDGKYKDVTYEIVWLNLPTGAQLNSEILANRLDIVSMADFPSIVGHDAFLTQNNGVKTVYIPSAFLRSARRGQCLVGSQRF